MYVLYQVSSPPPHLLSCTLTLEGLAPQGDLRAVCNIANQTFSMNQRKLACTYILAWYCGCPFLLPALCHSVGEPPPLQILATPLDTTLGVLGARNDTQTDCRGSDATCKQGLQTNSWSSNRIQDVYSLPVAPLALPKCSSVFDMHDRPRTT